MSRLQGWKIGAVLGLVYGILGWWMDYSLIFESPLMVAFGPLYVVSILIFSPFSSIFHFSGHEFFYLPVCGLIFGAVTGKGLEAMAGIIPDVSLWKKGTIIGFFIGLLGALCIGISPLFGMFLFGPLVYLTIALQKVILPGLDAGSNLPVFLLLEIVVSSISGSVAGYILGWEKQESDEPGNTVRRHWLKRLAAAAICIIVVGVILLSSGFIQPAKMLAPHYDTSFGRMTVLTPFPDSPKTMILYRVASSENGSAKIPERTVEIIPASMAFEKLKNGDFQGPRFKCFCDFMLENVSTGYSQTGTGKNQIYLEPAWVFRGTLSDGMPWEYYVYARSELQENDHLKMKVYTGE